MVGRTPAAGNGALSHVRQLPPLKLQIASIGKWKRGPEEALFDHYAARLQWPLKLEELPASTNLPLAQQQHKETASLDATARKFGAEKTVLMDGTGKTLSSEELAAWMGSAANEGARHISFWIGGDGGLEKSTLRQASLVLSLGRCTWPHLLVRALLAEQLFRSQCILTGHPYHRAG